MVQAFATKQLKTLWGPDYPGAETTMTTDIEDIMALNSYNGGDKIFHKSISYLKDR